MDVLGVILARRGSSGLKDKHLRLLRGRAVIEYTFEHALNARSLSRVVVSTDCPQIRKLADQSQLETIARPEPLATAEAAVQDVLLHALRTVELNGSDHAQAIVVLYGNVPVRPVGIIDRAVELLLERRCDSVRSFCPVGKWHPAWMAGIDADRVVPLHQGSIHRRQDLPPLYRHDGAVVAVSRAALLRAQSHPEDPHAFFGLDQRAVLCQPNQTVEIDDLRDLFMAEAILREQACGDAHDLLRMAS